MLFLTLMLTAAFVSMAWVMSCQLVPDQGRADTLRWLRVWSIKGLLIPAAIWALMNFGVSWNLQPYMPQIQAAQNNGKSWFPIFCNVLGSGLFVVSSYWAAATLAWVLFNTGSRLEGESLSSFKGLCYTCLLGMGIVAIIILLLGGWKHLGLALVVILAPIAGYAPGVLRPRRLPPMYARAIAKLKFGKYTEAEWEIIRQLESWEDDFEGWLMLADLYATQFNNVYEAEQTILEICDQPKTTSPQISIALHRLADWQLKIKGDPDAARRSLQMICDRLPGTHLARMAHLRINQLPVTVEDLRQQQSQKPIPMPALGDKLDEQPPPPESEADRQQAIEKANACVKRLKQYPNNISAREDLARLFAEHLNQADQGIEQLSLLLDLPGQPEAKRAEWLSFTAAWHLKYRQDPESAREILERLIRELPESPQAFAARRRLDLMRTESRTH